MKKSVFPKRVKGPVQVFELVLILAIQDKTVRARFKQWLSCVLSSRQDKKCIFGRCFCGVVRAYFKIFHSLGFKNLCSGENFSKENEEKNRKKKKKRKPSYKGAGNCVKVFCKKLFCKFFTKKSFCKNPQGLTFTQYSGWIRKPPTFAFFFYFLQEPNSSKYGFKGVGRCLAKNGERRKRQVYMAVGIQCGDILLSAVTKQQGYACIYLL